MIDQEKYISQGNEREYASELDYFNARFYDADLGRFNGVDPLASQFPSQSPFMSMDGNPVMKVDPTGLFADDIYYNHGREVARIENDKPDRYFYVNKAEMVDGLLKESFLNKEMIILRISDLVEQLKEFLMIVHMMPNFGIIINNSLIMV